MPKDEREELFKEVEKILLRAREADFLTDDTILELVNFIINYRNKIVEPLVKLPNDWKLVRDDVYIACKKTLKNAGVNL